MRGLKITKHFELLWMNSLIKYKWLKGGMISISKVNNFYSSHEKKSYSFWVLGCSDKDLHFDKHCFGAFSPVITLKWLLWFEIHLVKWPFAVREGTFSTPIISSQMILEHFLNWVKIVLMKGSTEVWKNSVTEIATFCC